MAVTPRRQPIGAHVKSCGPADRVIMRDEMRVAAAHAIEIRRTGSGDAERYDRDGNRDTHAA